MRRILPVALLLLLLGLAPHLACVQARAPDVYINTRPGPPPENIDSARAPTTSTHAEAQAELDKAYRQIRYLEAEVQRWRGKAEREEKRGDEYKRKYKRLKDKYDD
ncbi:MAG: hypothetical protein GY842_16155 [bacterium]|nr:hypothetical protein [bacterium]